jgi:Tol biopolymer transport system component
MLARAVATCSALAVAVLLASSPGAGARVDAKPTGKIVFAAGAPFGSTDLYTVDADGSHLRQLTNDPAPQYSPSWAPDGRSFVYVKATGNGALYRMKATGGKPRFVFKNPRETGGAITVMDPEWSPDGRRIAFSSTRFGSTWTIWTYGPAGRLVQVTKTSSVHPTWSPNGRQIAYDSPDGIEIVGLGGLGKRGVPNTSASDQSPAWSPDGKWIAVRSLNEDWQKHEADSLDIVSPAGTARKRLFTGNGVVTPAAWSPASDAVLVLRVPKPGDSQTQLFIVPLGGGRPKQVDGTNGAAGGASWQR